jgi:uncharacterized membrane protein YkoI
MRNTIIPALLVAAVAALPAAAQSTAQDTTHHAMKHRAASAHHAKASLASQAKISKDSAQKIALAQVANGTVKSSELEKEHGKLVYSFDITAPGQEGVEELNISAIDGSVIAHEHESAAKESAEAKAEGKAVKKAWKGTNPKKTTRNANAATPAVPAKADTARKP